MAAQITAEELKNSGEKNSFSTSTPSSDQIVRLWDTRTGALKPIKPELGPVLIGGKTFSPDGELFFSVYEVAPLTGVDRPPQPAKNQLPLWEDYLSVINLRTGKKWITRPPIVGATSLAVGKSPFNKRKMILAIRTRRAVTLVDAETASPMGFLSLDLTSDEVGNTELMGLNLTADGQTLAVPLSDSRLQLWDVVTKKPRITLTLIGGYLPPELRSFSPDGKTLAAAYENQVAFWDTHNGKKLRTISMEKGRSVSGVEFSPDGNLLAVGAGNAVRLYNARNLGFLKAKVLDEKEYAGVSALTFAHDSKTILFLTTIDKHPTVCRWRIK